MGYAWDFSSVIRYKQVLIEGLLGTLWLAALAVTTAMVVGIVVALCRILSLIHI